MEILEYLKENYYLSPFICELIDKESLDRFEIIIKLGTFDNVIEETVRKKYFTWTRTNLTDRTSKLKEKSIFLKKQKKMNG